MYDLGEKAMPYKFGQHITGSLVLSLSLLHNSKMRNMHIYQKKGQMQWILGVGFEL